MATSMIETLILPATILKIVPNSCLGQHWLLAALRDKTWPEGDNFLNYAGKDQCLYH